LTDVSLEVKSKNYTSDLYYRLIVPQILTEYDKIIVVDADMICREDIANVYTEDLGENLAGACIDCVFQGFLNGAVPWGMDYATHYLKLENPYTYVNTGFLLLNAKKYREAYSLQFLKDFIRQHISNVRIYEQDMLNMLLYAKIKFIDLKWNCYSKSNPFIEECFSLCPSETYREYEKARQQGGIIHYAARPKPWENVTVDLAELWWSYARQSPFYERFVLKIVDGKWEISKHETRLLYVNQHLLAFRLKKLIYQIKKSFHNGEKRDMYRKKYREVRDLIKEAVNFRNSISKM
jgi:lipopolysaccharide biosynthesis glycosyltransferase